jgi:small subunit ribosomal protein S28
MTATNCAKSFATLLRNSKFITQGDFRNSTVLGQVFHVVNDDLYVDFGMKFHAVVKKPREDAKLYVRGSTVRLKLIDYEIADRFIGSSKMTSLLEADAVLLGLESTPVGSKRQK